MGIGNFGTKPTAVVGIGNILLGDEGLGIHALRYLKEFHAGENVEYIDGGTMGLDLLPFIEGRNLVLFIDAVDFVKGPGFVGKIEESGSALFSPGKLSVHQIALGDLLSALKLIGSPPCEVLVIGMQPENMEVGIRLSDTVTRNFPRLIDCVLTELTLRKITVRKRTEGLGAPSPVPFDRPGPLCLPLGDLFPFSMI